MSVISRMLRTSTSSIDA